MLRPRALVAILLAVTWCSAAWHVQLEAAGMLFEHEHRARQHHAADHHHHAPTSGDDDHESVVTRDVVKDLMRVGPAPGLWIALLGFAVWLVAALPPCSAHLDGRWQPRETGPPSARIWQFLQRCAPRSAAPPTVA